MPQTHTPPRGSSRQLAAGTFPMRMIGSPRLSPKHSAATGAVEASPADWLSPGEHLTAARIAVGRGAPRVPPADNP